MSRGRLTWCEHDSEYLHHGMHRIGVALFPEVGNMLLRYICPEGCKVNWHIRSDGPSQWALITTFGTNRPVGRRYSRVFESCTKNKKRDSKQKWASIQSKE